ncbi:MAG TPA: undecaprenyl-diphosphate phosphatase [Clostridiales bacterium]|nr:undecaprenyl-diphosphate phosphatase [Clostridiales bacterium]
MLDFLELLKAFILGIVEGITEWLPVSSTGHLYLCDEFIHLNQSDAFKEMFFVVIQLSAVLAVVILYWKKLNPFRFVHSAGLPSLADRQLSGEPAAARPGRRLVLDRKTLNLWARILVSCIPAGIIGVLFNDQIDEIFYNVPTITFTLIFYGILFIVIENWNRGRKPKIGDLQGVTYKMALLIGVFQLLALIPGTSRSGATILGAMLIGASRTVAAEYTFFLAIPVMFGASLLKLLKFGFAFTAPELIILLTGMLVSFIGSVVAIRFLVNYVRKHNFKVFGWYRIALGIVLAVYFLAKNWGA